MFQLIYLYIDFFYYKTRTNYMDMLLALVFRVTEPPREISANTISEKTKKELK